MSDSCWMQKSESVTFSAWTVVFESRTSVIAEIHPPLLHPQASIIPPCVPPQRGYPNLLQGCKNQRWLEEGGLHHTQLSERVVNSEVWEDQVSWAGPALPWSLLNQTQNKEVLVRWDDPGCQRCKLFLPQVHMQSPARKSSGLGFLLLSLVRIWAEGLGREEVSYV